MLDSKNGMEKKLNMVMGIGRERQVGRLHFYSGGGGSRIASV